MDMFRQAIAVDPNNAGAAYQLGIALRAERQHNQAVKTDRVEETAALPVSVKLASESGKKTSLLLHSLHLKVCRIVTDQVAERDNPHNFPSSITAKCRMPLLFIKARASSTSF